VRGLPSANLLKRWAELALGEAHVGHLTIRLVNAAEAQRLNANYRKRDYPTNVLTFDYQREPLEADIVLCAQVLMREAREQAKPLHHHTAHLVIHGVLHALGHDHLRRADAARMEQLEIELLERLKIPNPYQ
jgi:probable rRNA maturation factor